MPRTTVAFLYWTAVGSVVRVAGCRHRSSPFFCLHVSAVRPEEEHFVLWVVPQPLDFQVQDTMCKVQAKILKPGGLGLQVGRSDALNQCSRPAIGILHDPTYMDGHQSARILLEYAVRKISARYRATRCWIGGSRPGRLLEPRALVWIRGVWHQGPPGVNERDRQEANQCGATWRLNFTWEVAPGLLPWEAGPLDADAVALRPSGSAAG
ncbi:hypothetical protein NDU88_003910 [Pleurodeles waltl]|uniref:Uncharacterized protein n=1 Tax=Pleurodeles waltl TaxID=8319 RepID=A0AAV7KZV9_PLEWA|nr:hypothetical protein NDU88_003910 [Pleurodeles waltl]